MNSNAVMRLVAGSVEISFGATGFFVSLLMLPASVFTVILSGVSVVMVTKGSYNSWTAARAESRLRPVARVFLWAGALAVVTILVLLAIFGSGAWPLAGFA